MKLKILISVPLLILLIIIGCKKFDLERIAMIRTDQPTNVLQTSVSAYGSIIDLGDDESVMEYGFCLSYVNKPPTIENKATPPFDPTSITGDFASNISGLAVDRTYQIRAYLIEGSGEVTYGNIMEFTTLPSGGSPAWLHYDDGVNYTSVGLTEGGEFDLAIRFPTQALTQYNGFSVTKVRFYPKEPSPTKYYITFWEGSNPPSLVHIEQVYPDIDQWNEILPSYNFVINSSYEFWAGLWIVDHPAGTHPAGCDEGPAINGAGNMISFDDGDTWDALYDLNGELNYNWNLQVYATNQKGEQFQIVRKKLSVIRENFASGASNKENKVVSAEKKN